jgi:hypothetical protein
MEEEKLKLGSQIVLFSTEISLVRNYILTQGQPQKTVVKSFEET